MRYIEIILKLAFLGGSIYSIKAETVSHPFLISFLSVCLVLGIVLIFNKDASYHFPQSKRDLIIRRIEGVLLIIFSIFVALVNFN